MVVLALVKLKPVLLPVKKISAKTADEAVAIFIFLEFLLALTEFCELVNHDSTDNLFDDDLDEEQVEEIDEHIVKGFLQVVLENGILVIGVTCQPRVRSEPNVQRERETIVQACAFGWVFILCPVEVKECGEHIGADESKQKHHN